MSQRAAKPNKTHLKLSIAVSNPAFAIIAADDGAHVLQVT
jgi:hypothetical protein